MIVGSEPVKKEDLHMYGWFHVLLVSVGIPMPVTFVTNRVRTMQETCQKLNL